MIALLHIVEIERERERERERENKKRDMKRKSIASTEKACSFS